MAVEKTRKIEGVKIEIQKKMFASKNCSIDYNFLNDQEENSAF